MFTNKVTWRGSGNLKKRVLSQLLPKMLHILGFLANVNSTHIHVRYMLSPVRLSVCRL